MVFPLKYNWDRLMRVVNEHVHSPQKIAPTGAVAVTVTSGAGSWALGDFSNDILANGFVDHVFDLHWVDIAEPSINAEYEIVFYAGATDVEICRVSFSRANVLERSFTYPLQTDLLSAGSRIRVKMMDSVGDGACKVKVFYHEYEQI